MADAHSIDPSAFWKYAQKSDGCWLWTGHRNHKGYGIFRTFKAHRFAWMITFGSIPDGLLVCHRCDTPACVRPDHLFVGTNEDNQRDMYAKGRGRKATGERNGAYTHPEKVARGPNHPLALNPRRGEQHAMAKLNRLQVADIVFKYRSGCFSQRELASEYEISQRQVGRIVNGSSWN